MAVSVLALQNDMALRHGPVCNFLALRLKGLQRHQPELFDSSNKPIFRGGNTSSVRGGNYAADYVRSSIATSHNGFDYNSSIGHQGYQRSLSTSNNPYADHSNTSSVRQTPTRRSPARAIRNTQSIAPTNSAAPDIDAMPLPVPGQLSAEETLAKALLSDPTAQAPPKITMAECRICHRSFDSTRLDRHMIACQKSAAAAAKRKEFDVQGDRVKKLYENDPRAAEKVLQQLEKDDQLAASGRAPAAKKTAWRKKSAELNHALGAASGGVVIPVEDDRVPCPSCGKKFAALTAARHIPSCQERAKRNNFK